MKSSVLIVGHPDPQKINFGADFVASAVNVSDFSYPVYVLNYTSEPATESLIKTVREKAPKAQIVLSAQNFDLRIISKLPPRSMQNILFTHFAHEDFESTVQQALARFQRHVQNETFGQVTWDQNHHLTHLSAEMKDIAQKREKSLIRSQKRFQKINDIIEALHKALLAVHSARSVAEIETQLFAVLAKSLSLSWVRIFLFSNDHLENQLSRIEGQKIFKAHLTIDSRSLGRLVVARTDNRDFTKGEEEALFQITESVALALDRLAKLEQSETLKVQWDSTFDAISEPLCLTDEKFNIIRTNKSFLEVTDLKGSSYIGQNCFSSFCGTKLPTQVSPSPNALLLERQMKSKDEVSYYEVSTQRISSPSKTNSFLMVMFRDVTEQKRIEKQIFESSKMAELGTIGSSIAHDINNPLGGMINFIQLIKMEISPDHPDYEDIHEMEVAGKRCKEIVENLLRFSRKSDAVHSSDIDVREVLQHVLKIIEIQTRPLGISIIYNNPPEPIQILGEFHLLTQALNYVMQNAFDAVSEKLNSTPGYKGEIKIDLQKNNENIVLTVEDNGVGINPENQNKILNPLFSTKNKKHGLGLTLAFQIVAEHRGRLEIFSQPNVGTTVKISFINV